jgi:hypothetical protein
MLALTIRETTGDAIAIFADRDRPALLTETKRSLIEELADCVGK